MEIPVESEQAESSMAASAGASTITASSYDTASFTEIVRLLEEEKYGLERKIDVMARVSNLAAFYMDILVTRTLLHTLGRFHSLWYSLCPQNVDSYCVLKLYYNFVQLLFQLVGSRVSSGQSALATGIFIRTPQLINFDFLTELSTPL